MLVVVYNKYGETHEEFLGEVHISLADYKHFKVIDDWYKLEDLVSLANLWGRYESVEGTISLQYILSIARTISKVYELLIKMK